MGSRLLTDIQHQNKPLGLLLEKWKHALLFFLRFKFLETARSQKSPTQKLKGHFKRTMPSWPRCQQCVGLLRIQHTELQGSHPVLTEEGGEWDGGGAAHPKKKKSTVDSGKVGKDRGVGRIGVRRERWREADPCHQPGQPSDFCQGYRETVTVEVSLHMGAWGRWLR